MTPDTSPDTAPTPERVGELLNVAEAAAALIDRFGPRVQTGAFDSAFDPPTAIALCRDWQRLRAEVERLRGRQAKATSPLTEGVQIAKDAHRLEADLTAQNAALSAEVERLTETLSAYKEATGIVKEVGFVDDLTASLHRESAALAEAKSLLQKARAWVTDGLEGRETAIDSRNMLARLDAFLAAPSEEK